VYMKDGPVTMSAFIDKPIYK